MNVALAEIGLRAQRDPTLRATVQQRAASWQDFLTGILATGVREEHWPRDLYIAGVTAATIALVQSVSLNATLSPSQAEQTMRQLERWLDLSP